MPYQYLNIYFSVQIFQLAHVNVNNFCFQSVIVLKYKQTYVNII